MRLKQKWTTEVRKRGHYAETNVFTKNFTLCNVLSMWKPFFVLNINVLRYPEVQATVTVITLNSVAWSSL